MKTFYLVNTWVPGFGLYKRVFNNLQAARAFSAHEIAAGFSDHVVSVANCSCPDTIRGMDRACNTYLVSGI